MHKHGWTLSWSLALIGLLSASTTFADESLTLTVNPSATKVKIDLYQAFPSLSGTPQVVDAPDLGIWDGTYFHVTSLFQQIGLDSFTVSGSADVRYTVLLASPLTYTRSNSRHDFEGTHQSTDWQIQGASSTSIIDGTLRTRDGGIIYTTPANGGEVSAGATTGIVRPPTYTDPTSIFDSLTLIDVLGIAQVVGREKSGGDYEVRAVFQDGSVTNWFSLELDPIVPKYLSLSVSRDAFGSAGQFPQLTLRFDVKSQAQAVLFSEEIYGLTGTIPSGGPIGVGAFDPSGTLDNFVTMTDAEVWTIYQAQAANTQFEDLEDGILNAGWSKEPMFGLVTELGEGYGRADVGEMKIQNIATARLKNLQPIQATEARMVLEVDLTRVDLLEGESMTLLSGTGSDANPEGIRAFDVVLLRSGAVNRIWLRAFDQTGAVVRTTPMVFDENVPLRIAARWKKGLALDTKLVLVVNGTVATISGFNTATGRYFEGALVGPASMVVAGTPLRWVYFERVAIAY